MFPSMPDIVQQITEENSQNGLQIISLRYLLIAHLPQ